jgi:hypothetical protein
VTSRLVLGAYLALEEAFGVHAYEDGVVVFPLRSRPMFAAALKAGDAMTRRLHLGLRYGFENFRDGISPVRGRGCSFASASWTTTQTVMAGIGWRY